MDIHIPKSVIAYVGIHTYRTVLNMHTSIKAEWFVKSKYIIFLVISCKWKNIFIVQFKKKSVNTI